MKKVDELKQQLEELKAQAQVFIDENKPADAKAKMEEIKNLKESIIVQQQLDAEQADQINNKINSSKGQEQLENVKQSANTVRAMIKKGMGRSLTEAENALLIPTTGDGTNGEGFILPKDVTTKIKEKIREYKSFRDVLGYIPTTALSGSFPMENFETVSELVDFTDGIEGAEATDITFTNVSFSLKEKGALITLSNTLLAMTDNDLIDYVARIFARKAVVTENKMAIAALKNGKTAKTISDWKALKKSINVDLNEGIKFGTVVVTNQDAFDVLDSALDGTGRPVLQPDPTNSTFKRFMGYPVIVFDNSLLPTTGTTTKKAPVFYGNLKEAASFVDNKNYNFAISEHAGFTKNATIARVIEHVDVIQVDKSDKVYIYGEVTIS